MKKIVLITNIPSPYRIPLFNEIAKQCVDRGLSLKVLFLTKGYERRKWIVNDREFRFAHRFLESPSISLGEGFYSLALSLPAVLAEEKPDCIITGGFSPAALWTSLYCRMNDVPYIAWSGDTIAESGLRGVGGSIRNVLRRGLIQSAKGFVVYGRAAREYLLTFHVPAEIIHIGINTVDTEFIIKKTSEHRTQTGIREGLPEKNLCFIGYLEYRKGVHVVLDAIAKIQKNDSHKSIAFHIVGSGTQEEILKQQVQKLGLKNIFFYGFKQKEEIPHYLAMSDALIFPSLNELFGLVPVEAMSAGIPVLCSKYAGCAPDLIEDGRNGILFDPLNGDDTANAIEKVLFRFTGPERKKMSENATDTIRKKFSVEISAEGFLRAIQQGLSPG